MSFFFKKSGFPKVYQTKKSENGFSSNKDDGKKPQEALFKTK